MTDLKGTLCRLCLKNITDKGFKIVDDVTRNILDVLLPKLKVYGDCKEIICNTCTKKLNAAYVFKSTCMNTNNAITPHVDRELMLQLDLGQIYLMQKGSGHATGIPYDHKICRLCMQPIKSEIRCIEEEELGAIHKFVPEMNIMIVKDPVLCKLCVDSLSIHNNFLKECLEVDQKMGDHLESSTPENETETFPDLFIKTENLDRDFEINEEDVSVKTECIDIKSEEDEETSDPLVLHPNIQTFENSDYNNTEEDKFKHMQEHKNVSKFYKCETCEYGTEKKVLLYRHKLRHKDSSEVYMHKCDSCYFKSKYKHSLIQHQLRHKNSSEVQMYKCDSCDYESRYKKSVTKHKSVHKDPSEVRMYRCKDCDFKTKNKRSITSHIIKHQDISQVQMYKCDLCDYETVQRRNIQYHARKHKDLLQVQLYKCNECSYESKYKQIVTKHQWIHKDPSEVHMYRCKDCNFETKYKRIIRGHIRKHKDLSQV